MRTVIYILFFTLASSQLKATNQIEDLLFYNKDTLSFYDSPLEQIKNVTSKIHELNENLGISSDCWRGYRAEWKLINNTLYLSNVYEGFSNRKINKVIEKIVGCKFKNGLMRANWVNGTIWTGKDIVLEKTVYTSIFKHECKMYFENGTLVNSESFDFIPCDSFSENMIARYVESRINWENYVSKNILIEISAYLTSNKNGKPMKVKIENSSDAKFNDEIERILLELPCMPVYFNQGEFWNVGESIMLTFNTTTKKIYVQ